MNDTITLREAHDMLWDAIAYAARLYREPWQQKRYMDVYNVIEPLRREVAKELRANA